jgi:hypothetical protein
MRPRRRNGAPQPQRERHLALAHRLQPDAGQGAVMRTIQILSSLAVVTMLVGSAAAEPPRCRITKIKDKEVSIDVPVTQRTGQEIFCKTSAQRVAKRYAIENPVCSPTNARESTFSLTATWGDGRNDQTFELKSYCPMLAHRK